MFDKFSKRAAMLKRKLNAIIIAHVVEDDPAIWKTEYNDSFKSICMNFRAKATLDATEHTFAMKTNTVVII